MKSCVKTPFLPTDIIRPSCVAYHLSERLLFIPTVTHRLLHICRVVRPLLAECFMPNASYRPLLAERFLPSASCRALLTDRFFPSASCRMLLAECFLPSACFVPDKVISVYRPAQHSHTRISILALLPHTTSILSVPARSHKTFFYHIHHIILFFRRQTAFPMHFFSKMSLYVRYSIVFCKK